MHALSIELSFNLLGFFQAETLLSRLLVENLVRGKPDRVVNSVLSKLMQSLRAICLALLLTSHNIRLHARVLLQLLDSVGDACILNHANSLFRS